MPRTLRRSTARSAEPETDVQPEEETRSSRRGRRSSSASDEDKPSRGGRRGRVREEESAPEPEVDDGWGGYEENRQEYGDRAPEFSKTLKDAQDDDRDVLIKFVDEAPFAVFKQHWIERGKGKKKSFNCIAKATSCPLCDDLGDNPATKVAFNVISLDDPDKPRVEVWLVGQRVADMIKKLSQDKKSSPLNRDDLYFAVTRSGTKGGSVQTNIAPVKERDLEEDWDCEPLTEDDLNDFDAQAFDKSWVEYPKKAELEDVADEALDH